MAAYKVREPGPAGLKAERKSWEHRTVPPETTFRRLEPFLEVAAITRIADLTGLDRIGIPVFQAVRPLGLSLSASQGKGATAAAARVSAVMEALEIWHAETETLDGVHAAPGALKGRALDRDALAAFAIAPPDFDLAFAWTEATDCTDGGSVFVPRDLANLDFTRDGDPPWLLRSTDGLAGGNTLGEALASATAELIERACTAAFRRISPELRAARRINPRILAAEDDRIARLVEPIQAARLELELFDMTNDLGVTAIEAVIYDLDAPGPSHLPCLGHGAHLDPVTAVTRAITEAAQTRLTHVSGNRDDILPDHYSDHHLSNTLRRFERGFDMAGTCRGLDLTDRSGASPAEDFSEMVARITAKREGPVLFVDLTKPHIGVPVAKVLAPGLRRKPPGQHANGGGGQS